jgi:hypothetical protein
MGYDGKAYEYVIENGQVRKLKGAEEQLAKQMREVHDGSWIRSLTSYEIKGQRRYVSVGDRVAFAYGQDLKEAEGAAGALSAQQQAKIQELEQKRDTLKQLLAVEEELAKLRGAVLSGGSTYGPIYQLPPQDPYAQLAQQISKAHGGSTISSLISYEINGQRRYVSMDGDGKAYEYVIEGGAARKLGEDEEQLSKEMRAAHGENGIDSLTSYEISIKGKKQKRYVSMGEDGKAYEYVIEGGAARKLKNSEEQLSKRMRAMHGSRDIYSLTSYEISIKGKKQKRYVSMGEDGEAYEYVIEGGAARKLGEDEEQLSKEMRAAHGENGIDSLTSYEISIKGQEHRRYVSMGGGGEAYEYVIEGGVARKLKNNEEQLSKEMRAAHGLGWIESLTSYEISIKGKKQKRYVSMGEDGEAYEYVIEGGAVRKLGEDEEQLSKEMRAAHGENGIDSLTSYEISIKGQEQRRYVSVGAEGAFAYGQDLKEAEGAAGALSVQQQAKIQELERKRDTLKQLLAAVLPSVRTYGPVYQLPPQDPYAQLAQQIRNAHGKGYGIYSLTSYEINGERHYVSVGYEGKAYEYVIENGQARKLKKTEEQLAKQIRQAHGNTGTYSLTSYEIDGQRRYVSMGNSGEAYEYVIENGQARQLKETEEQLAKQMREAHGDNWINSLISYDINGQRRYVSMGSWGRVYEYVIENGQARKLKGTEEQLAKQMRKAHDGSVIESLIFYEIKGQRRYVSMGENGKVYEYVIENGQARKLEKEEEQLAKQMREAHGNNWINSLISYDINGQSRYVSIGHSGEAYEYVIENGQARKLKGTEEQLAKQMREAHRDTGISSLTSYEINNQRRYVSVGNDGAFAYGQDQKQDQSMKVNGPGGIDLTPANMNLQTQNNGGEIKFHLDPAMLEQLRNAPGFVPVIINIQPMTNLRTFLGLADNQSNQQVASL